MEQKAETLLQGIRVEPPDRVVEKVEIRGYTARDLAKIVEVLTILNNRTFPDIPGVTLDELADLQFKASQNKLTGEDQARIQVICRQLVSVAQSAIEAMGN